MTITTTHIKHNDFDHVLAHGEHGRGGYALRVYCSDCSRSETIRITSKTCDQQYANRMFTRHGWQLGSRRTHDVCPHCVARQAKIEAARRAERLAEFGKAATVFSIVQAGVYPVDAPQPTIAPAPSGKPTPSARIAALEAYCAALDKRLTALEAIVMPPEERMNHG